MTQGTEDGWHGWICTTCKKVISSRPFGQCEDCGGSFRAATEEDLECDRCGAGEGRRLLDRTGEFDRLCKVCLDEVLLA